jgi:NADPH2:quinone reductase
MRAAVVHEYGPPSGVVVEDLPNPSPAPGQVVVRIAAAAVNFADVLVIANKYQHPAPVPFTPGSEFAGTVTATAPDVEGVRAGDRVLGTVFVGAFAEEVVAQASSLTRRPASVDFAVAVAGGVAYATSYHALRSVAAVQPGEWVVVLGAAGGVGLAAVQLAHLMGARGVAAASSPEKLAVCAEHGADGLINYETEDLKEQIRALTGGGADIIIDPVGGKYAEPALRAGRWGARFVTLGFAAGEIPRIPLNLVLLKGVVVMGMEIWGFSTHQAEETRRDRAELMELLASGRLQPHVSATHPLDEVVVALETVAGRRATGKVLITPNP